MKSLYGEYLKIVMYTIIGVVFIMASYTIILNVNHYSSLQENVSVSELDSDYSKYKDNIVLIEDKINNYSNIDNKLYKALNKSLNIMKKSGVFRLVPKSKLTYKEIYDLNDYFIEELINNSWVHDIKEIESSEKYQDTIDMLINNSKYINSIFTSNSLTLYDDGLDNKIDNNYHFILRNYSMYSDVILSLCSELGGENG